MYERARIFSIAFQVHFTLRSDCAERSGLESSSIRAAVLLISAVKSLRWCNGPFSKIHVSSS